VGIARRRRDVARAAALVVAGASAVGACAVGLPAHAQSLHDTTDYLDRMDADGDGRVSLAEYQAWMAYGFEAMDRDHDGVLSPAELPGGRGAPLTREAHRARLAAVFARQDRDRDGFLDAAELASPLR
jgi:Ca2+-binding EF-hand superfamily protein